MAKKLEWEKVGRAGLYWTATGIPKFMEYTIISKDNIFQLSCSGHIFFDRKTLKEAKEKAQRHFNKLISEITDAPLIVCSICGVKFYDFVGLGHCVKHDWPAIEVPKKVTQAVIRSTGLKRNGGIGEKERGEAK